MLRHATFLVTGPNIPLTPHFFSSVVSSYRHTNMFSFCNLKDMFNLHLLLGMFFLTISSPQYIWDGFTGSNFYGAGDAQDRTMVVFNVFAVIFSVLAVMCVIFKHHKTTLVALVTATFFSILISLSIATNNFSDAADASAIGGVARNTARGWQFAFQWVSFCLFFITMILSWFLDDDSCDDFDGCC